MSHLTQDKRISVFSQDYLQASINLIDQTTRQKALNTSVTPKPAHGSTLQRKRSEKDPQGITATTSKCNLCAEHFSMPQDARTSKYLESPLCMKCSFEMAKLLCRDDEGYVAEIEASVFRLSALPKAELS